MGVGGYLQIVNGTNFVLNRTSDFTGGYQMASWDPSAQINPGTCDTSYVEFTQSITTNRSNTQGSVSYTVGDTGCMVSFRATDVPPTIKVRIDGFSTDSLAAGTWLDIHFKHDGPCTFVLFGAQNAFHCTPIGTAWMTTFMPMLQNLTLQQLCVPGSHDAGMSELHSEGSLNGILKVVAGSMIQAQTLSIYDQLVQGSRFFDIRPVLVADGKYWTGHFSSSSEGEVGSFGQSMDDVISDINKFLLANSELVIVNLSHAYDATNNWSDLTGAQWTTLLKYMVTELQNLCTVKVESYKEPLIGTMVKDLMGGDGSSASVIIRLDIKGMMPDPSLLGQGVFSQANFPLFNSYSNTDDKMTMIVDQIHKLRNYEKIDGAVVDQLHLVSWTLTPNPSAFAEQKIPQVRDIAELGPIWGSIVADATGDATQADSIKALAHEANMALYQCILPVASKTSFPNVLLIDWYSDSNPAALAMAINFMVYGSQVPALPAPPQQYIEILGVEVTGDNSTPLPNALVDAGPGLGSADCNHGFGGDYTWVVAVTTTDPTQAITGISVDVTSSSIDGLSDMASSTSGDFRYVKTSSDPNSPKITAAALWRSPDDSVSLADVQAAGWAGMTSDINSGRSGDYLYIVWKTAD
ncbi:Variant-surface-glycoprotein phospholipase C [Mycena sanguinolenta]|uniref:Variant-surface-glycoprotein phospholipase C n=1 Tax=Mycena sanguinolenta TaxID=230812 RepID=A0A8H6YAQ7_9AGAR|nr:Variant-surface-glycoprotein phospholipase C [Mycena sanguinolenta]